MKISGPLFYAWLLISTINNSNNKKTNILGYLLKQVQNICFTKYLQ
jgi:hypothetical protein